MAHKTHVCIEAITDVTTDDVPKIKKGEYLTLRSEGDYPGRLVGGKGWEFEEYVGYWYATFHFLPIPPPIVKYVALDEEVKQLVEEPMLN